MSPKTAGIPHAVRDVIHSLLHCSAVRFGLGCLPCRCIYACSLLRGCVLSGQILQQCIRSLKRCFVPSPTAPYLQSIIHDLPYRVFCSVAPLHQPNTQQMVPQNPRRGQLPCWTQAPIPPRSLAARADGSRRGGLRRLDDLLGRANALRATYGCGSKNRYQNGTLVSGNMDQNLRNPSCSILSHTHIAPSSGSLRPPSRSLRETGKL